MAWLMVVGLLAMSVARADEVSHGTLLTERLNSSILEQNRIGLNTRRSIKVLLPPGYAESRKSYPVVYFLHNIGWSPDKMFQEGHAVKLLERGFARGIVKEFIFVVADYTTPTTGSIYENSPVSGRWLDFTVDELVPFIDKSFRTLAHRDSRAVVGDFFGGRGALKLAMSHADVFGVAYALHPVATGNGTSAWTYIPIDWPKIHQAKSFAELDSDGRTQLFVTISQAFLPNLDRPPFYCDFFMEMKDGRPTLHVENIRKTKAGFLLEETLNESAANLRTMRGLALDWGRFDTTYAHVESNRTFSRLLDDLGVEHEAEEYRGGPWDRLWTEDGRFYARVLPFLARHLVF
jgi:S-formylglutathione hydrolase FrmB